MNAAAAPLDRDAMRLVAEIGFIGTQSGQPGASRAIFESLRVLRPESSLPFIGLALTDIACDRPEDAARLLREQALAQHPGDAEVMAFLGLALQAAGRNADAAQVLTEVLQRRAPHDEPHVRMAERLLNAARRGPAPSPLIRGPVGPTPA